MNGESSDTAGGDKTETTQVVRPSQDQAKATGSVKPTPQEAVVSLHDTATDAAAPEASSSTPQAVVPTLAKQQNAAVASPQTAELDSMPQPQQPAEPASPWNVSAVADDTNTPYDNPYEQAPLPEVHWTASEFIAHEKSPLWYLSLAGTAALLIALAIFLFHDIVAVVSIFMIAILFGAVASHKPRTLEYTIDAKGIAMGAKVFSYDEFKSFGVVKEEAFSNITLTPLKRFSPPLSIYYPPEEEENIVQVLAAYLPIAPVRSDMIDGLLRRIRL